MLSLFKSAFAAFCFTIVSTAMADTVIMNCVTHQCAEKSAGTIQITETKYGLLFTPNLHGMKPGIYGFHIHQYPDCGNNGMAAGGHLDPFKTNKHLGPYNIKGHLGDLPALFADSDGSITLPVLAPRLTKLSQVKNHSLMIHVSGDNYADHPKPLGGGGERMLCGIVR